MAVSGEDIALVANADIVTMDPNKPSTDSMAIAGDRIVASGNRHYGSRRHPQERQEAGIHVQGRHGCPPGRGGNTKFDTIPALDILGK